MGRAGRVPSNPMQVVPHGLHELVNRVTNCVYCPLPFRFFEDVRLLAMVSQISQRSEYLLCEIFERWSRDQHPVAQLVGVRCAHDLLGPSLQLVVRKRVGMPQSTQFVRRDGNGREVLAVEFALALTLTRGAV